MASPDVQRKLTAILHADAVDCVMVAQPLLAPPRLEGDLGSPLFTPGVNHVDQV